MKERIGIAGCGSMGLPMAKCLLAGGYNVHGFDIRPIDEFGDFSPHMIENPQQFAASTDVVISVVRDQKQTLDLLFNEQAIFSDGSHPKGLIISSTLPPSFLKVLTHRLPAGIALMDAPMSGAPFSAEQGTLTFMLGGENEDIARWMPLFQSMGEKIYNLGPLGSGMTVKVLNNYVAASSVVAVRRVIEISKALGTNESILREVLSTSSGGTWFGSNFERISWASEGFEKTNTIGIVEKDVRAALETVDELPEIDSLLFDDAILDALRKLKPIESQ
ncbi:MAG: NAD(P)-dependent oxidoreductase [SAR324 cluster bacterium]|nr:NAD(P)-dependent oxidoreductase [SAR324 cluster bacterium]